MKDDALYAPLMLSLLKAAKQIREKENPIPVAIFVKGGKIQTLCQMAFKNQDDKQYMLMTVGAAAKKEESDAVIIVMDTALRMLKELSPEQLQYIHDHMDTESPLTQPEGMFGRRECLMLSYCDLVNNITDVVLQEYVFEGPERKVVYKERLDTLPELQGGRFEGNVLDYLKQGYDNSDQFDIT